MSCQQYLKQLGQQLVELLPLGPGEFLTLARPFQHSPEQGAEAVVAAMSARSSGSYFRGGREVAPSKLALDDSAAARLWELSVRWLKPAQIG